MVFISLATSALVFYTVRLAGSFFYFWIVYLLTALNGVGKKLKSVPLLSEAFAHLFPHLCLDGLWGSLVKNKILNKTILRIYYNMLVGIVLEAIAWRNPHLKAAYNASLVARNCHQTFIFCVTLMLGRQAAICIWHFTWCAALGYAVAACAANMEVANVVLPLYVTVLLFFTGLLIRPLDQPAYWHWFSYIDFIHYAWASTVSPAWKGPLHPFLSLTRLIESQGRRSKQCKSVKERYRWC